MYGRKGINMGWCVNVRWHPCHTLTHCTHMMWKSYGKLNTLAPGTCSCNSKLVMLKLLSMTDMLNISCGIALLRMPHVLTDVQSTLVQVMVWCHQATRHYLNQCWPSSIIQWVNTLRHGQNGCYLAVDIFKCIFIKEFINNFLFKFH